MDEWGGEGAEGEVWGGKECRRESMGREKLGRGAQLEGWVRKGRGIVQFWKFF